MFNLDTILKALPVVGPLVAAAPEFRDLFNMAVQVLHPKDQETAKAAYAAAIADNDEGHDRLQRKLAEAAKNK